MFLAKEDAWLRDIQKLSSHVKKHGKLFETQETLLRAVYQKLSGSSKTILMFSAPPSSGKTHVIALLAVHFSKRGKQTCIVVPNGELTVDFEKEKSNLVGSVKNFIVLTLSAYVRRSQEFQIALVDECHNLRSAIELDPARVKTFSFRIGEYPGIPLFGRLVGNSKFIAKALGGEDLRDILTEVSRVKEYESTATKVLNQLSRWTGYLICTSNWCVLKLMNADTSRFSLLPRERLLLFSATPLTKEELSFYCGIEGNTIEDCATVQKSASTAQQRPRFWCLSKSVSDATKNVIVSHTLARSQLRSLLLLNNRDQAITYYKYLDKSGLDDRLVMISTGLRRDERSALYRRYLQKSSSILVTASTVYWEGINIPDLKLLMIPNRPYPQPSLIELVSGRELSRQKIVDDRLTQAMGRIGRTRDRSLGVLLFHHSGMSSVNPLQIPDRAAKFFSHC